MPEILGPHVHCVNCGWDIETIDRIARICAQRAWGRVSESDVMAMKVAIVHHIDGLAIRNGNVTAVSPSINLPSAEVLPTIQKAPVCLIEE